MWSVITTNFEMNYLYIKKFKKNKQVTRVPSDFKMTILNENKVTKKCLNLNSCWEFPTESETRVPHCHRDNITRSSRDNDFLELVLWNIHRQFHRLYSGVTLKIINKNINKPNSANNLAKTNFLIKNKDTRKPLNYLNQLQLYKLLIES